MMMVYGIMLFVTVIFLLLAFLGDRTASGLQWLARDRKESEDKTAEGSEDTGDLRETPNKKQNDNPST